MLIGQNSISHLRAVVCWELAKVVLSTQVSAAEQTGQVLPKLPVLRENLSLILLTWGQVRGKPLYSSQAWVWSWEEEWGKI